MSSKEKSLVDWDDTSATKAKPAEKVSEKLAPNTPREVARHEVKALTGQVSGTRSKIANNSSLSPDERKAIDHKLGTMEGECKKIDFMLEEGGKA